MKIETAIHELQMFSGQDLTQKLSDFEAAFVNMSHDDVSDAITTVRATNAALTAAFTIKRLSAQIDVKIHALAILRCLPKILESKERIESLSLGAGNTGRDFDLETNMRIAEFKFIHWQGGAESVRQNGVFKDFYQLAEDSSTKTKFLYLLDTYHPLKFFSGGRAIESVFKKEPLLLKDFRQKYPEITVVREYFEQAHKLVSIVDVSDWLPELHTQTNN